MGVNVFELKEKKEIQMEKVSLIDFGESKFIGKGNFIVIERRFINSYRLVNLLMKDGIKVFTAKAGDFKGNFVLKNDKVTIDKIKTYSKNLGIELKIVNDLKESELVEIKKKNVGIYQPWITSMDEGWTRLVLDSFYFDYRVFHNKEMKDKKTFDEIDVLILPSMGTNAILEGRGFRGTQRIDFPSMPEEYEGGIGKEGVENIKNFLKRGGTLITLGEASNFAIEQLGISVRNDLKNLGPKEFFAPGTIVNLKLNDPDNPISYGLTKQVPAYIINPIAFSTSVYSDKISAIATFDDENVLLSGYLLGSDKIKGKIALCEVPYEKGKILLFAFRPQHRSQTWATFKFLFNAILN